MTELTQARLKELLHYKAETGVFTRAKGIQGGGKIGSIAGYPHHTGYIYIGVALKIHLAHRLAWLYIYGEFPKNGIDHINGIKTDNRIINLRACNQSENLMNTGAWPANKSGYKGVSWNGKDKRWRAQARLNRKFYYLGQFMDKEAAAECYQKFCKDNHGIFYRS